MNNKELKNETWKFLINISAICFITISIIIYVIIKNVDVAFFVTLLFWPLIILLLIGELLSLIVFLISIIKLRKFKKMKEVE